MGVGVGVQLACYTVGNPERILTQSGKSPEAAKGNAHFTSLKGPSERPVLLEPLEFLPDQCWDPLYFT